VGWIGSGVRDGTSFHIFTLGILLGIAGVGDMNWVRTKNSIQSVLM